MFIKSMSINSLTEWNRDLKHFHQTSPDFFSFRAADQQINTHWSVIKHVLHCVFRLPDSRVKVTE